MKYWWSCQLNDDRKSLCPSIGEWLTRFNSCYLKSKSLNQSLRRISMNCRRSSSVVMMSTRTLSSGWAKSTHRCCKRTLSVAKQRRKECLRLSKLWSIAKSSFSSLHTTTLSWTSLRTKCSSQNSVTYESTVVLMFEKGMTLLKNSKTTPDAWLQYSPWPHRAKELR